MRCMTYLAAAIASFAICGLGANDALAQAPTAAEISKARPLGTEELYRIYNSRSWIWDAGAGHFSVRKREFSAWTNESGSSSIGVGRWFLTDRGKLCFRAVWRSKDGSAPALTCFAHREIDGVIYQKREPKGEWYVFRSAPPRKGDESAKLRYGDYVVTNLRRFEASVGDR